MAECLMMRIKRNRILNSRWQFPLDKIFAFIVSGWCQTKKETRQVFDQIQDISVYSFWWFLCLGGSLSSWFPHCCVFRPSFGCCAHPKAGVNTSSLRVLQNTSVAYRLIKMSPQTQYFAHFVARCSFWVRLSEGIDSYCKNS